MVHFCHAAQQNEQNQTLLHLSHFLPRRGLVDAHCGCCTLTLSSLLGLSGVLLGHTVGYLITGHGGLFSAAGRARKNRSTRSTAPMTLMRSRLASENGVKVDTLALLNAVFCLEKYAVTNTYLLNIPVNEVFKKHGSVWHFFKHAAVETGRVQGQYRLIAFAIEMN